MKFKRKSQTFIFSTLIGLILTLFLASCNTVMTDRYEATAQTTLTWQVQYLKGASEYKRGRFEEFDFRSLVNRNGNRPENAGSGPDDRGLWWPRIPPKPSIDDIEQRQKNYEKPERAELLREVKYEITYQHNGESVTLPTNYQVYRQVIKAYPDRRPLRLTMGVNDRSIEKAEPLN